MYTLIHTYMLTLVKAHTHAYKRCTYTNRHTHMLTQAKVHTHTRDVYTHTHIHTPCVHTHTEIDKGTHICIHEMHTHVCTYMLIQAKAFTHAYMRGTTHTCPYMHKRWTHTYTHAHTDEGMHKCT